MEKLESLSAGLAGWFDRVAFPLWRSEIFTQFRYDVVARALGGGKRTAVRGHIGPCGLWSIDLRPISMRDWVQ